MTFGPILSYEPGMKIIQIPVPEGHGKAQLAKLSEYLPQCCLFQGPWLAGGTVRRMVMGENVDVADLDYFFSDYFSWEMACTKIERVADARLKTAQATTYRIPIGDGESQIVQCIKKNWYSNVIDLMKSFDFRVCQFFSDGVNIIFPEKALTDAQSKRLCIAHKGEIHTEAMYARLSKYLKYGYRPDAKFIWETLKKVKKAGRYEARQMASPNYSDSKNVELEAPNPTGLGPAWQVLYPKEKING